MSAPEPEEDWRSWRDAYNSGLRILTQRIMALEMRVQDVEKDNGSLSRALDVPQWGNLEKELRWLWETKAMFSPDRGAWGDQMQALIRDTLDEMRLTIRDEWVQFHGLAFLAMFGALSLNAKENGRIDEAAFGAIREMISCVAFSLADYIPPPA